MSGPARREKSKKENYKMKKAEQMKTNAEVQKFVNYLLDDFRGSIVKTRRLRHCKAEVVFYENKETGCILLMLISYNTAVAAISEDGTFYDFLRYVYGYTNTSAKHIAYFYNDYSRTARRLTWRPCK